MESIDGLPYCMWPDDWLKRGIALRATFQD